MRTRGGLERSDQEHPEVEFDLRLRLHRAEKQAIARVAASIVRDDSTIALDASTTALYLARELRLQRRWAQLRVITNGLRIASELARAPGISVMITGGQLRGQAISLVRGATGGPAEGFVVDTAFVGATGLRVESGLHEATHDEAISKSMLIAGAGTVVAIVDSTKWGRRGGPRFCPFTCVERVISDGGAPPTLVAELERIGVAVSLAYTSRDGPLS